MGGGPALPELTAPSSLQSLDDDFAQIVGVNIELWATMIIFILISGVIGAWSTASKLPESTACRHFSLGSAYTQPSHVCHPHVKLSLSVLYLAGWPVLIFLILAALLQMVLDAKLVKISRHVCKDHR